MYDVIYTGLYPRKIQSNIGIIGQYIVIFSLPTSVKVCTMIQAMIPGQGETDEHSLHNGHFPLFYDKCLIMFYICFRGCYLAMCIVLVYLLVSWSAQLRVYRPQYYRIYITRVFNLSKQLEREKFQVQLISGGTKQIKTNKRRKIISERCKSREKYKIFSDISEKISLALSL